MVYSKLMKKRYRKNLQLDEITALRLDDLRERYGTYTKAIAMAVWMLHETSCKEVAAQHPPPQKENA